MRTTFLSLLAFAFTTLCFGQKSINTPVSPAEINSIQPIELPLGITMDQSNRSSVNNDLTIGEVSYRTVYDTGISSYYSRIPYFFARYDTIQFSGQVTNNGVVTQENTRLTNHITTPTGTSTLISNRVNLNPGLSDTLIMNNLFVLDQGMGMYSWAFSVASDSTEELPFDNALDRVMIEVTDTSYSRDFNTSGNYGFGTGSSYEIGLRYDIYDTIKATSISIAVGSNSAIGDVISVYIYDANSDLSSPLTSRELIVLDSASINSLTTYSIPQIVLSPGSYIITYKTYTDEVYYQSSNYDASPGIAIVRPSRSPAWEWTTSVPPIRLNVSDDLFICDLEVVAAQLSYTQAIAIASFGTPPYSYLWSNGDSTDIYTIKPPGDGTMVTVTDAVGCTATDHVHWYWTINENEIEGDISMYPNPNNGSFQLSLEGVQGGNYKVSIKNGIGQTVYENPIYVTGNYNQNIALKEMQIGFYLLELTNDKGEKSIVKFVVN